MNCFINKILAYIQIGVWPVHWVAGSRVFDGSVRIFDWFNFSWVLALTQPGLFRFMVQPGLTAGSVRV